MVQINKGGGPLYDLSKLKKIGNDDFVRKMILLFIKEVPPSVMLIKVAYMGKDFATLKYLAHRIRPSLQNMGISRLTWEADEIENLAALGKDSPGLEEMIEKLDQVVSQVVESLKAEFKL